MPNILKLLLKTYALAETEKRFSIDSENERIWGQFAPTVSSGDWPQRCVLYNRAGADR